MKNSTELIILNHTKFGENSIVIHTLSQAYGRRSFLVRVGRKSAMSLGADRRPRACPCGIPSTASAAISTRTR